MRTMRSVKKRNSASLKSHPVKMSNDRHKAVKSWPTTCGGEYSSMTSFPVFVAVFAANLSILWVQGPSILGLKLRKTLTLN